MIKKAKQFSKEKHFGQVRDGGEDYFSAHIEQVVAILSCVTNDEEILAAAYLHDTVEDCGVTYQELIEQFNVTIANLVMEVTHEGKKDHHGHYFPRLFSKKAYMIKFADRLSNISQMEAWSPGRQKHYLNKSIFWKTKGPNESGNDTV